MEIKISFVVFVVIYLQKDYVRNTPVYEKCTIDKS